MKEYTRFLTQEEAKRHFNNLVDIHFRIGRIIDRANSLRSRFDIILRTIITRKYEGKIPGDIMEKNMFKNMINDLFMDADQRGIALKANLHQARDLFNNKVQHLKDKGSVNLITENEYKFCLRTVSELVSFFSGVAIPAQLLDASYILECKKMKKELDIVIILQLFDTLQRLDKGMIVYDNLRKMMSVKNQYGFNKLNIQVVLYNPQLSTISSTNGAASTSPTNEALYRGIDILDQSITKWVDDRTNETDRPWLMWMFHSIDFPIDTEIVEKIDSFTEAQTAGFYPVNMGEEKFSEQLVKYWPECKPLRMNPDRADNFFNTSLLLTIQRMQEKN